MLTSPVHLIIDAYGENRFNVTYDPCDEDVDTLCPVEASTPIRASGAIEISADDIAGMPSIALGIPDVEGFARLHIFANSSESEIGCFQGVLTNGHSFSQRQSVSVILAVFTFLTMVASFAAAIYGVSIAHMRTHYAHSISVLVVIETFQSIFLTGALSVNWPSVLPAWWSNFAWTAGMVANDRIVQAVGGFTGNAGNVSQVGGAGPFTINNAGGLLHQIYGRAVANLDAPSALTRRAESDEYSWHGDPRISGLPLPGTWPGLGGTLSSVKIPPADAFIIGLIWFMTALASVALLITLVKLALDVLVKAKVLKTDGFNYFRSHWLGYVSAGLMRTLFIGFFVMVTLALYQLSLRGRPGPTALAAVILVISSIGLGSVAAYACFFRLRHGKYAVGPDTIRCEKGKLFKTLPFIALTRESKIGEEDANEAPRRFGSIPFFRVQYINNDPERTTVHLDDSYTKRFGWLSSRYRRTRWWFFAAYLFYQFVRACFLGGASQDPLVQVYGLFIFEIIALLVIMKLNPFEGHRNTVIAVWILSVSKIMTTGLSIAFLPQFALNRTNATVVALIIVVIQGFVGLAVMVLTVVGMISTWMSLSRNTEKFPTVLEHTRVEYFEHIEHRARDIPGPRTTSQSEADQEMDDAVAGGTFNVREVRRAPKIEDEEKDEDHDAFPDLEPVPEANETNADVNRRSRANSASSRYSVSTLPRGARVHRASWSSKDFSQWDADTTRHENRRLGHKRSSSLRIQALAAQGITSPDDGEAVARWPMTPARESMEDLGPILGRPNMVEEVDDEEKKPETRDVATSDGSRNTADKTAEADLAKNTDDSLLKEERADSPTATLTGSDKPGTDESEKNPLKKDAL